MYICFYRFNNRTSQGHRLNICTLLSVTNNHSNPLISNLSVCTINDDTPQRLKRNYHVIYLSR